MILIAIGSNLAGGRFASPKAACEAALAELERRGVRVAKRSRWWRTRPMPPSDQPWFVNGAAQLETDLPPDRLLAELHAVEADFGRMRAVRNEARVIDLDLLAYDDRVTPPDATPALPHPRMAERPFVLGPLVDVAPDWRHPILGRTAKELLAALPADGGAEPMKEA